MVTIRDIPGQIWRFISPRKTQQRREREFRVPALPARPTPLKKQLKTPDARSISPESRVKKWTVHTPETSGDMDIDATLLPPSPPASAKPLDDDDLEGDTLLPSSPGPIDKTGSSAEEWDANEETMVVDDDKFFTSTVDVGQKMRNRDRQGRELREAGWSEDAVFLFQKLGMRGFEPLLPMDWLDDLETLPADLFTAKLDKAFLKPAHGSDYNAQLALSSLFDLGGRARDAHYTKASLRTPAYQIRRAIERYTAWAMKDGDVVNQWNELPLFRTVTLPVDVHASVGEIEMISKLKALYEHWEYALKAEGSGLENSSTPEVPTLYGVTASHTLMAFVSYVPPTEENSAGALRLIAMFDFGKDGFDVWNSLAIAIFITHCRNRMMQLKEYLPEPDVSSDDDPDA